MAGKDDDKKSRDQEKSTLSPVDPGVRPEDTKHDQQEKDGPRAADPRLRPEDARRREQDKRRMDGVAPDDGKRIVRIDPNSPRVNHTTAGGRTFRTGMTYEMSVTAAEPLKKIFNRSGNPGSGRVFLVQTREEAKAYDQRQLEKARAPRGTIDNPISLTDD